MTKTNLYSRFPPSPWKIPNILNLKSARCHLERIYINTQSISDWKILRTATNRYYRNIRAAKRLSYSLLLSLKSSHSLEYHNKILHRTVERSLPSVSPLSALQQMFVKCFADKISKLHLNLQSNNSSTPAHFLPSTSPVFHHFTLPPYQIFQIYFPNHLTHSVTLNLSPLLFSII